MAHKNITQVLPLSLVRIIEEIEYSSLSDPAGLIGILEKHELRENDFMQFNTFTHPVAESYGRNRIHEGRNYSVFVMSWLPGDFTAIHNHGIADWGAVYLLGDVDYRIYTVSGNSVYLTKKGRAGKGTIAPVNGKLVHAMGNRGKKPVMTLHIYGTRKNISNANDDALVYELEKKQIRRTPGAAYINIPENLCRETIQGVVFSDDETVVDYFSIIKAYYERNNLNKMVEYLNMVMKKPEFYSV